MFKTVLANLTRETINLKSRQYDPLFVFVAAQLLQKLLTKVVEVLADISSKCEDADSSAEYKTSVDLILALFNTADSRIEKVIHLAKSSLTTAKDASLESKILVLENMVKQYHKTKDSQNNNIVPTYNK